MLERRILYGFLTLRTAIQNGFTFVLFCPVNSLISNKNDNFLRVILKEEKTRIFATFNANNFSPNARHFFGKLDSNCKMKKSGFI